MKQKYRFSIVLALICFWGCLSSSSLFAQPTDETPKSVNLSLHLRPAFHAQFNGTPLEFERGEFKFDHIIVDLGGDVTSKLSYRYLQRLNKVSPVFIKENLPSSIDYLKVSNKSCMCQIKYLSLRCYTKTNIHPTHAIQK